MTPTEYQIERRHVFETRLAILGAAAIPTADQQNMAAEEADAHIAELKSIENQQALAKLLELRDSL
jgi:hypothetical protein